MSRNEEWTKTYVAGYTQTIIVDVEDDESVIVAYPHLVHIFDILGFTKNEERKPSGRPAEA